MNKNITRLMTEAARGFAAASSASSLPARKVVVMGAAGGIGQPLSMLMKVDMPPHVPASFRRRPSPVPHTAPSLPITTCIAS